MNDINLNQSNCIQQANYLTYTQYTNVCTGNSYSVEYGTLDVAGPVIMILGFAIVGILIFKMMND